jgi:Uma2 family endonuclease
MPLQELVTADDLMRIPEDNWTYELEQGQLIQMPKPGVVHGYVGTRLYSPLAEFVEERTLGVVFPQDTGFLLTSNPDTVRGPDLSFVSESRFRAAGLANGFWPGAPDLAVEVRSPNDRWPGLVRKANEYLRYGSRLVWVLDPDRKVVVVFRPSGNPATLTAADALDGGDVVPGFQLAVSRLFDGL